MKVPGPVRFLFPQTVHHIVRSESENQIFYSLHLLTKPTLRLIGVLAIPCLEITHM